MSLVLKHVFCGKYSHQDTVVLIVVLERAVAADGCQAAEVSQVRRNLLHMLFVTSSIDGVAPRNANDMAVQHLRLTKQASGLHLARRPLNHSLVTFGPQCIWRIAPIFK